MQEHSHCPDGCEHPQPIELASWGFYRGSELVLVTPKLLSFISWGCEDGNSYKRLKIEICGRCWHRFGEFVVMEPCTPANCAEARDAAAPAG